MEIFILLLLNFEKNWENKVFKNIILIITFIKLNFIYYYIKIYYIFQKINI